LWRDGFGFADVDDVISALRELTPNELVAHGISVAETWDEIDDPVLIGPEGLPIETWREGYPYDFKMSRHEYEPDPLIVGPPTLVAADAGE
jgi:hypothetical protein